LWRFRPQRLDAEIVRDNMLAVGGNINLAVGGEPDLPFIPKTFCSGSTAASGRTRRKVRRRGGAASTSISGDRCRIRCSTRSIIRT
jgi:hypothetical protein